MGLAGYYRRFIEGFSNIAHPITSLQNKGARFECSMDCARSFHHLKSLLTSAPILRIVDPEENFVVWTDAWKVGVNGVLIHNGHVVCYELRKLKEHENIYATHDLELTAILHALRMWRHYLMGKRFELRTNHYGMKYLFGQSILNSRQSRWLELLSEYDFDINHIRGNKNKVVDALSRRMNEMHATTIIMY
jgi:hypothetical protein